MNTCKVFNGTHWVDTAGLGVYNGREWVAASAWTGTQWQVLHSTLPTGGPPVDPPPDPEEFILGVTKPNASNTGVVEGTVLTVINGDTIISTAGAIYRDCHFVGNVGINAVNVSFYNCLFTGRDVGYLSNTNGNLIHCYSEGAYFERCTMRVDYPLYFRNCIGGGGVNVYRCDMSQGTDAIYCNRSNVILEGSYLHDFYFTDQDSNQSGSNPPSWSHNDGIQFNSGSTGGSGSRVIGNNFYWYPVENGPNDRTAILETGQSGSYYPRSLVSLKTGKYLWGCAITPSPTSTAPTDMVITDNWFEGGTACFQMSVLVGSNFGVVARNRYGHDQYDYGSNSTYQIRYKTGYILQGELTNFWDPDVSTVPPELVGKVFEVSFTGGIRRD